MKVFVFDAEKCNGCLNCQFACKDEHVGNDWYPIARPQQDRGEWWTRVDSLERGQVPKVSVAYTVRMCRHCDDAPCMKAAPEAVYKRDDGLVIIDPDQGLGRRDLAEVCPYGAISYNEELDLAQKCTGCAHLLDDGWSSPRCVDACGLDALRFGDEEDFADELSRADALDEEVDAAVRPRVYYLNLPKRFLGGIVVDIDADEVVIGVTVTLENAETGEVLVTETDDFGDFWFRQIEAAPYNVYVEADGYLTRMVSASTVDEDRNIGVVELFAEQPMEMLA